MRRHQQKEPRLETRCYVEHLDDTTDVVICEAVPELKTKKDWRVGCTMQLFGAGIFMLVPRHQGRSHYDEALAYLRLCIRWDFAGRLVLFAEVNQMGQVERRPRTQWMRCGRRVLAMPDN